MTHVAFLGVGAMGLGMAARLAGAGQRVVAYDVNPEALARARAAGCESAASATAAVKGASVVITMLATGAQVRAAYAETIVPTAEKGALVVDCSTIDVETARAVAAQAAGAGLRPADAPVSGGTMAAEAGTLAFMVGCDEALFEVVRQSLSPMARVTIHAGGAGAGQAAKICNNMVLGVSMLGVCEAFGLAEKLGLAPERFFEIASQSSGQCWSLTTYCPWPGPVPTAPSNRDYEGGFLTALMLKDLKLAQEAAAKSGATTPLGAQAEALYALFDRLGYGRKDFSAVLQLLRGKLEELA
jgi:3-hydroxyisobutyrate dehydrogenase